MMVMASGTNGACTVFPIGSQLNIDKTKNRENEEKREKGDRNVERNPVLL